jgi:hypothetical protein
MMMHLDCAPPASQSSTPEHTMRFTPEERLSAGIEDRDPALITQPISARSESARPPAPARPAGNYHYGRPTKHNAGPRALKPKPRRRAASR